MQGSFMKLFRYISGTNSKQAKIPMTAPVLTKIEPGQGPNCESTFVMSFYQPYSLQVRQAGEGRGGEEGHCGCWLGQGSRQLGGGPAEHPRALVLDAAPCADMRCALCAVLRCAAVQGSNSANAPKPTGAGVSITDLPALEVYVIPYGE